MVETTALVGMTQICLVIPRSEATILEMKRRYPNMPIHREREGGEWLSDREELLRWWRLYVRGAAHLYGNPQPSPPAAQGDEGEQPPDGEDAPAQETASEEQEPEDEQPPAEGEAPAQKPAPGRRKKAARG